MQMQAVDEAKFAVVHVLAHLLLLAAGEADVVVKTVTGCVELVADVVDLCGVEVRHGNAFSHRLHLGKELELRRTLGCWSAFAAVGVALVVFLYVYCKVAVVKADDIAAQGPSLRKIGAADDLNCIFELPQRHASITADLQHFEVELKQFLKTLYELYHLLGLHFSAV